MQGYRQCLRECLLKLSSPHDPALANRTHSVVHEAMRLRGQYVRAVGRRTAKVDEPHASSTEPEYTYEYQTDLLVSHVPFPKSLQALQETRLEAWLLYSCLVIICNILPSSDSATVFAQNCHRCTLMLSHSGLDSLKWPCRSALFCVSCSRPSCSRGSTHAQQSL